MSLKDTMNNYIKFKCKGFFGSYGKVFRYAMTNGVATQVNIYDEAEVRQASYTITISEQDKYLITLKRVFTNGNPEYGEEYQTY